MLLNSRICSRFAQLCIRQKSSDAKQLADFDPRVKKTIIHGIATGVPEEYIYQKDYGAALMQTEHALDEVDRETLMKLLINTKIEKRHLVHYSQKTTSLPMIEDKMEANHKYGSELAVSTARNALLKSNFKAEDIEKIVFVSSTGFGSPGIDTIIIDELGLSRNISRSNVGFMGCGGGLNGLTIVNDFCVSKPGKAALLVCLELHSIHDKAGKDMSYNVKRALFGDGCAAVVMSGESEVEVPGKWAVQGSMSHLVENSADIFRLSVDQHGMDGALSPELPKYVKMGIRSFIDELMMKQNMTNQNEINLWGVHPGGPAILRAVQSGLGLEEEHLKESWDVLKNYGNMSSATVWFVLDKIMKQKDKDAQNLLALAFGPGVNIEGVMLKKC